MADDLGIQNKIVRKKLMHWLKTGLREYHLHLKLKHAVLSEEKQYERIETEN